MICICNIPDRTSFLRNNIKKKSGYIVLDNAPVHRHRDVRRIIVDICYELKFLYTYSYVYNPHKNSFTKIKNSARS